MKKIYLFIGYMASIILFPIIVFMLPVLSSILHDAGIIYITYYIAVIFSFTIAASVAYVKFWDSI